MSATNSVKFSLGSGFTDPTVTRVNFLKENTWSYRFYIKKKKLCHYQEVPLSTPPLVPNVQVIKNKFNSHDTSSSFSFVQKLNEMSNNIKMHVPNIEICQIISHILFSFFLFYEIYIYMYVYTSFTYCV